MNFFKQGFKYVLDAAASEIGTVNVKQYSGMLEKEIDNLMFETEPYLSADREAAELFPDSILKDDIILERSTIVGNVQDVVEALKDFFSKDDDSAPKNPKEGKTMESIMQEAFKSGLSGAHMLLLLNLAPLIVDGISLCVEAGEVTSEDLKKEGLRALSQTGRKFLLGTISATVSLTAKSGMAGAWLQNANSTILGAITALTYNSIDNAIKVAGEKMTKREYVKKMMNNAFISAFSVGSGLAWQAILPQLQVFPYMIGSFVGSVIGGFTYNMTEKVFLSYCVESGCTFFGLVEQDYEMDEAVLSELGLEMFHEEASKLYPFEENNFVPEGFGYKGFQYERFGISILKRDVIGVFKIGYI